jgi:hypothetical protein
MAVTNDVDRFLGFTKEFRGLADHFLMAGSGTPEIKPHARVLAIPPDWLFPASFPFIFMRRDGAASGSRQRGESDDEDLPRVRLSGPARMLPLYMPVQEKSGVKGEGHMMVLSPPSLPQEAVELMLHHPVSELIEKRALWLPTDRFASKDPFLSDLRLAHERGLFPVYFDRLPVSEGVTAKGGVQISISNELLNSDGQTVREKLGRGLQKLVTLGAEQAQAALLDLPDLFSPACEGTAEAKPIGVWLCEFVERSRRILQPVLTVQDL